jgi:branched-subunit amino acid ABC-type transport system permease component
MPSTSCSRWWRRAAHTGLRCGSLWGTLLGGMLLGVTQVLVSQVSVPYATLASQLLFLVVLAVRPHGLLGTPQVAA